uniref:UDP-N-acetylglucosamine--dolichyl-phosphate N-acetylglucosaminephosphotransferase n=1 Tax=Grammatophora oceanica TaxID=210454 RepID=A0A7S1Y9I8_9STRA|mmetsp:Transcript_38617/g.57406  ORF Transcript_38617/g.57406 Transcript_38617/m.57406 type:complete len:450 (+) Transcript_38617:53-1402(+)
MSKYTNPLFAIIPLIPSMVLMVPLLENPVLTVVRWVETVLNKSRDYTTDPPSVASQLLAYTFMGVVGFWATNRLIPHIKTYTLRKGISGKDLGKRGTKLEDNDVPEALGIVPGAIFLVCLIFCLVGYDFSLPSKLLDVNSAILSICFMLFLGFTDDVLDWPWRYKLFLPTVASLPLLCCYNGPTSIVVPLQLRSLLMVDGKVTMLGNLAGLLITVDSNANGAIVNLGIWYFVYMGMLAVFCTNAINIYAGINGLEAGQSYVIACFVLIHNLVEIQAGAPGTHLFATMIMLPFLGVTAGLLRHNWYPASVFVGDTFCYFAGMTFAVVGILGHFSKTLLLFFIPQVLNFIWSIPQLFKLVPCPRHRLPRFDAASGKMYPSTFPCKANELRFLKRRPDDTECANMTVINLTLQLLGPMTERNLCLVLLGLQVLSCSFGLFVRYYLAQFFFDE